MAGYMPKSAVEITRDPSSPSTWMPKSAKPIDIDAEARALDEEALRERLSKVEAGGLSMGPGTALPLRTLNLLTGGVAPNVLGLKDAITGTDSPTDAPAPEGAGFGDRYRRNRDFYEAGFDVLGEVNPKATAAGTVLSGFGAPASLLRNPAGLPLRQLMRAGVKPGAFQGAATALGSTRADLTKGEVGAAARDTLIGGTVGGVGGFLAPAAAAGVGRGSSLVRDWMKRRAENQAIKAAGPTLADARRLMEQGRLESDGSGAIGRDLLDQGVVRFGLRRPFGTGLEEVAERAGATKAQAGARMGAAIRETDQILPATALPTGDRIADRIEQEILAEVAQSPSLQQYAPAIQKMAETYRSRGSAPMSAADLNKFKSQLQGQVSYGPDPSFPMEFKQRIARILREEEDAVVGAAAQMGGKDAAAFPESKRVFGSMKDVATMADDRAMRGVVNRMISPSDYGVGGVGALDGAISSGGDTLTTLGVGTLASLANKFARDRGNSIAAVTLDTLSDVGLGKLMRQPVDRLGKYAQPLADAFAEGGEKRLGLAVQVLAQRDPEFRKLNAEVAAEDDQTAAAGRAGPSGSPGLIRGPGAQRTPSKTPAPPPGSGAERSLDQAERIVRPESTHRGAGSQPQPLSASRDSSPQIIRQPGPASQRNARSLSPDELEILVEFLSQAEPEDEAKRKRRATRDALKRGSR